MESNSTRSLGVTSAVFLTAAVVLVSAGTASAGPFDPAYRGDDNSVHAVFDWVNFGVPWDVTEFSTGASFTSVTPSRPVSVAALYAVSPPFFSPLTSTLSPAANPSVVSDAR